MSIRLHRRSLLAAGLAGPALLLQPRIAPAQTPQIWRFAHTTSVPGTVWHQYATEIVPQRIREASKGAVQIQVLTGVVQPGDLMSNIRQGVVQGGSLIMPYVGATLPTWNIMALPGLVQDERKFPAAVNKVLLPFVREDAKQRFKAVPVMFFAATGASWFSNVLVDRFDKIAGKKYRAHSPELTQLIQAAGGAAVPMHFGEVGGALQKNMIDGYTAAIPPVNAAKLYEATKYAENWPAGLGGYTYFIGEEALAKLDAQTRSAVLAEFDKLNIESQQAALQEAESTGKELVKKGMKLVDIPAAERQKVVALAREKVWPLWEKNAGEKGVQLLHAMQEALK